MEGCEWLSDHVLEEIAQLARAEDTTENTEAMFWQQSLASVNQGKPLPVEVITVSPAPLNRSEHSAPLNSAQINGAHKRKGVKVEPIDDSGQLSRNIEGRLDWKERAAAT
jgi:hypothetical protein